VHTIWRLHPSAQIRASEATRGKAVGSWAGGGARAVYIKTNNLICRHFWLVVQLGGVWCTPSRDCASGGARLVVSGAPRSLARSQLLSFRLFVSFQLRKMRWRRACVLGNCCSRNWWLVGVAHFWSVCDRRQMRGAPLSTKLVPRKSARVCVVWSHDLVSRNPSLNCRVPRREWRTICSSATLFYNSLMSLGGKGVRFFTIADEIFAITQNKCLEVYKSKFNLGWQKFQAYKVQVISTY